MMDTLLPSQSWITLSHPLAAVSFVMQSWNVSVAYSGLVRHDVLVVSVPSLMLPPFDSGESNSSLNSRRSTYREPPGNLENGGHSFFSSLLLTPSEPNYAALSKSVLSSPPLGSIPRGGEIDTTIVETTFQEEFLQTNTDTSFNRSIPSDANKLNDKHLSFLISPKRLWQAARTAIQQTTTQILGLHKLVESSIEHTLAKQEEKECEFDELDRILDNVTSEDTTHVSKEEEEFWLEDIHWPPPKVTSLFKGWNRRSLQMWIAKMEQKFLSSETAQALGTIRNILESFPEYGVVDLFGLYSPKDVILSVIALSRLQRICDVIQEDGKERKEEYSSSIDEQLINDLAHYVKFAHAAYGWKGRLLKLPDLTFLCSTVNRWFSSHTVLNLSISQGLAAFCGRFHLGGDNRALVKRTGIERRDILMTNWHSKTNRPAFFVARDKERKTIVLSIRGTMSPRDILTDLCASSENFFVEDVFDSEDIGNIDYSANNESHFSPIIVKRAHKGMVLGAKSVARMTGKLIGDELRSNADYSLVVVGHSLGGGVAAVLATMWMRRFKTIRCYGYGMPCAFPISSDKKDCDQMDDNIVSLIGEGDPFSVISLGHVADVTSALSRLCQDRGFRDDILLHTHFAKLTPFKDIPQQDISWSRNAMECLRKLMKSEKLYPPGKILLMTGSLFRFNVDRSENGTQETNDSTPPRCRASSRLALSNRDDERIRIEEESRLKVLSDRRKTIRGVLKAAEGTRNFRLKNGYVPQLDPETNIPIKSDTQTALSLTAFIVAGGAVALRIGGRAALVSPLGLDFTQNPELRVLSLILEVSGRGKGFDFASSICDGLVLSPALLGAYLKYADPLFDESKVLVGEKNVQSTEESDVVAGAIASLSTKAVSTNDTDGIESPAEFAAVEKSLEAKRHQKKNKQVSVDDLLTVLLTLHGKVESELNKD
eukprot:CCRYP_003168-RB/>CCRYP_003168-RB protein AED:0.15 eAED:0.15 QI:21/0.71/0.37/1/0.85/0.75/8/0/938